jgi:hypothetical protein
VKQFGAPSAVNCNDLLGAVSLLVPTTTRKLRPFEAVFALRFQSVKQFRRGVVSMPRRNCGQFGKCLFICKGALREAQGAWYSIL